MPRKKSKEPLPDTKKIGGKRYELGRIRNSKRDAKKVAKSYRDDGYKARVVPSRGRYGIYVRRSR